MRAAPLALTPFPMIRLMPRQRAARADGQSLKALAATGARSGYRKGAVTDMRDSSA